MREFFICWWTGPLRPQVWGFCPFVTITPNTFHHLKGRSSESEREQEVERERRRDVEITEWRGAGECLSVFVQQSHVPSGIVLMKMDVGWEWLGLEVIVLVFLAQPIGIDRSISAISANTAWLICAEVLCKWRKNLTTGDVFVRGACHRAAGKKYWRYVTLTKLLRASFMKTWDLDKVGKREEVKGRGARAR